MQRQEYDLEVRTRKFAVAVIRFVATLPKTTVNDVLSRQLLRSATSIGANYREACRGASRQDFIYKIGIVEREAAETQYWLELCNDTNIGNSEARQALLQESGELLAIFTTIGKNAKKRT